MITRLKKEFNELKDSKIHIESKPISSNDIIENFNELFELSKRVNSRYKIIGDIRRFSISTTKTDNYIIGIMLGIVTLFCTFILINNIDDYIFWIIFFGIVAPSVLFALFYPLTKEIEIDTVTKNISYISRNLIGKILKTKSFKFHSFEKFSSSEFKTTGKGMNNTSYNKIYIHLNNEKLHLIDLFRGPIYFIKHNIFMTSLTNIIKNSA